MLQLNHDELDSAAPCSSQNTIRKMERIASNYAAGLAWFLAIMTSIHAEEVKAPGTRALRDADIVVAFESFALSYKTWLSLHSVKPLQASINPSPAK